jgi:hypothetical protein
MHPMSDNIAMIAINQGSPFHRVVSFATTQILAVLLTCYSYILHSLKKLLQAPCKAEEPRCENNNRQQTILGLNVRKLWCACFA